MANEIIETLVSPADFIASRETEPNNLLRQANPFGDIFNFNLAFDGNVSVIQTPVTPGRPSTTIRDTSDVFSFAVDRPTILDVKLNSDNPTDAAVRLIKDFDGDGLNGLNELLASSNLPGKDTIKFDRLDPGTYFLEVTKNVNPASVNYTLIPKAVQIAQADLTIGIERLIPLDVKTDVVVQANINGQKQTSPAFRPLPGQNINLTSSVDPGQRELNMTLNAFRSDAKGAQIPLDLDRRAGKTALEFTYDTLTRQVKAKDGNGFFGSENQIIRQTVRGDGEGTISGIQVSYATSQQAVLPPGAQSEQQLLNQGIPVVRGSSGSDPMQGGSQSGILLALGGNDRANGGAGDDIVDGGKGKDTLLGSVGEDILIGGDSNDILVGGNHDDILDGGRGSDRLTGGLGSDAFVLAIGKGTDTLTDFRSGQDLLGLANDLTFNDLKFVRRGDHTVIQAGQEQLAIVQGINPSQFTATDFVSISMISVLEATVPVVT